MQKISKVLTAKEDLQAALNGESFSRQHDFSVCKHKKGWEKRIRRFLELAVHWTVSVCEKFAHWSREHHCVHIQT